MCLNKRCSSTRFDVFNDHFLGIHYKKQKLQSASSGHYRNCIIMDYTAMVGSACVTFLACAKERSSMLLSLAHASIIIVFFCVFVKC